MIHFKWHQKHAWILGGFEFLHADNITANAGSGGATLASDDIGGVQYPRTKMVWGADGAANDTSAASPLPVVQTGTPSLPTGAATESTLAALNLKIAMGKTIDFDSDAGEDQVQVIGVALPSTSGAVIGGTSTNPLRVDPTGTTTQPISAASLPLPSGAATQTSVGSLDTKTAADVTRDFDTTPEQSEDVKMVGIALPTALGAVIGGTFTDPLRVDPTGDTTQPISAAALPLPTGAATAAKQPALGTAGTPSADILSVQGASGMTALDVNIVSGGGSGGTSATDDAAFTPASGSGTPIMGFADETLPDAVDEGDVGVVRMTLQRALHVNLRDASGSELSVGGGTQYDEDTAHVSGDKLTLAGAVRRDTAASGASADGDRSTINVDASGRLWVNPSGVTQPISAASLPLPSGASTSAKQPALGTAGSASADVITVQGIASMTALKTDGSAVTQPVSAASLPLPTGAATSAKQPALGTAGSASSDVLSVQGIASMTALKVDGSAVTQPVSGTVTANAGTGTFTSGGVAAHDAAVSGNPVRVAGRAASADYTSVADGDTADILTTLTGKPVILPYAIPASTWSYAAAAGGLVTTGGVTAKAAGTGSQRHYITSIQVINSHATTSTEVAVKDGAGGTVLHRGWAQAAGGGYACKFDPPLRGSAATLVEIAEITATATTGVLVNLQGYTAAE